jgi:hypothetical protein
MTNEDQNDSSQSDSIQNDSSQKDSGQNDSSRTPLFGPPPLLEGEDAAAYDEMAAGIFTAIKPNDFIEQIWACDLADAVWQLLRLRRILAAYLSAKVLDAAEDKALQEQDEMTELQDLSKLSLETLIKEYMRVVKEPCKPRKAVVAAPNIHAIQAEVIVAEMDTIERIEHLIAIAERRFDAVIHEVDRHRITQKMLDNVQQVVREAEIKTFSPKSAARQIANKKIA